VDRKRTEATSLSPYDCRIDQKRKERKLENRRERRNKEQKINEEGN
jgi:hypothetical protein